MIISTINIIASHSCPASSGMSCGQWDLMCCLRSITNEVSNKTRLTFIPMAPREHDTVYLHSFFQAHQPDFKHYDNAQRKAYLN